MEWASARLWSSATTTRAHLEETQAMIASTLQAQTERPVE
jgi:hypothetical protein